MRKFSTEKGKEGEPVAEINITPLGDVSLTLLIILMIISPMIMQSMIRVYSSKALPTHQQERKKEKPLFINITKKKIYLNTRPIRSDLDLASRLINELMQKRNKTVLVTAEYNVTHGKVVHVLDIAKQSGAEKISLLKSARRK